MRQGFSPPITADHDCSPQGLHDVRQGFSPPITADHDCSPQGLHDVRQGFSPPITTPADRLCCRSLRDARAAIRACGATPLPQFLRAMKCGLKPFLRTWKPLRGWGVRGRRRRRRLKRV